MNDVRSGLIGLVALAAVIAVLLVGTSGLYSRPFEPSTQQVHAQFPTTQQLRVGTDVRIHGIRVGTVKKISPTEGAPLMRVSMEINRDAPQLQSDARAAIAWKLLLGGSFVVNLDPGTPGKGSLQDDTIQASNTSNQVELEDILAVNQGNARRGLETLPSEAKDALADPRLLAKTLDRLADASPATTAAARALRGDSGGKDLRRLIRNAATAVSALDSPDDRIRSVIENGAVVLGTTANRAAEIEASIEAGPAVTKRVTSTLTRLERTLDVLDPVVDDLRDGAPDIAPTLRELRPTLLGARQLLRDAEPSIASLRPATAALREASQLGPVTLDGVRGALRRVDDQVLPDLAKVSTSSKRPTYQMIGPSIASIGNGAAGAFDAASYFFRFPISVGEGVLDNAMCRTLLTDPTAQQLLVCQNLGDALKRYLTYSPFAPASGNGDPARKKPRP